MNVVAEMTLSALAEHGVRRVPGYRRALVAGCNALAPPFGKQDYIDLYRKNALDPDWVAVSLIASSVGEGKGACHLWDMAACTRDSNVSSQIKEHAIDEARHSRAYLKLLEIVFPEVLDEQLGAKAHELVPNLNKTTLLTARDGAPFAISATVDELIQMNIGEIRTRIHQFIQRPVLLAYCPPHQRRRVKRILDSLLLDETRHIAYTAQLIENAAQESGDELVIDLMHERLRDFNEITDDEIAGKTFVAA